MIQANPTLIPMRITQVYRLQSGAQELIVSGLSIWTFDRHETPRTSRTCRDPVFSMAWMPAFAGMTN